MTKSFFFKSLTKKKHARSEQSNSCLMATRNVIRARGWMFTVNNVTEENCFPSLPSGVRRMVYQMEKAPETGTIHFQGYLEMEKQVRLTIVKKVPGLERAHLEMRNGTPAEAYAYCTKEESRVAGPWVLGEPFPTTKDGEVAGQGHRSDLQACIAAIQGGASTSTILTEHASTFVRYPRGCQMLIEHVRRTATPSWRNVSCLVLQGRTGTGKTRKALEVLAVYSELTCAACARTM